MYEALDSKIWLEWQHYLEREPLGYFFLWIYKTIILWKYNKNYEF